ncbi:MAG TPA: hypothetical protein VGR42_06765 [Casimicrobiaceae bacterium]|nr:hypothetical protein [Casimicrobiaceae bacterium]
MRTHLIDVPWKRRWLTFLLMGLFFLLFGVMTANIFVLLKANIDLYRDYGTMVIGEGALLQLAELIGYGYLSLLFYMSSRRASTSWLRTSLANDEEVVRRFARRPNDSRTRCKQSAIATTNRYCAALSACLTSRRASRAR